MQRGRDGYSRLGYGLNLGRRILDHHPHTRLLPHQQPKNFRTYKSRFLSLAIFNKNKDGASEGKIYGKTKSGVVISEELIEKLAAEAERGYDLEKAERLDPKEFHKNSRQDPPVKNS